MSYQGIGIGGGVSEDEDERSKITGEGARRYQYSKEVRDKKERYRAKGIKYELTIQEEADEQYKAKTMHSTSQLEEVVAIYRIRTQDRKEFVTWNVVQSAVTNLENIEVNYPVKRGYYDDPEVTRQGYLTDEGVLKTKPVDIKRIHKKYTHPFSEEFVRELFAHSNEYEVQLIAMADNAMESCTVPDIDHLIYMDMQSILNNIKKKDPLWPPIEECKVAYQKRLEEQRKQAIAKAEAEAERAAKQLEFIKSQQEPRKLSPVEEKQLAKHKALQQQQSQKPSIGD